MDSPTSHNGKSGHAVIAGSIDTCVITSHVEVSSFKAFWVMRQMCCQCSFCLTEHTGNDLSLSLSVCMQEFSYTAVLVTHLLFSVLIKMNCLFRI